MPRYLLICLALVGACTSLLLLPQRSYSQIPWVETGFDGTPLIDDVITEIEANDRGHVVGVVGTGPTMVQSTDGGINWTFHTAPSSAVSGLEYFNDRYFLSTLGKGLFESTDLDNWKQVDLGTTKRIESIDADKGLLIVRLSNDTVLYLPKGFSSFVMVPHSLSADPGAFALNGEHELLYLAPHGYWRSNVGGTDWTRLSNGMKVADMTVSDDSLYIGTRNTDRAGNPPWLYASSLASVASDNLRDIFIEGSLAFEKLYTTQDSVIIAVRRDTLSGKEEVHYSIDRSQLSPPLRSAAHSMYDLSIRDGRFFAATKDGVFENSDYFVNWNEISRPLEANVIEHLVSLPERFLMATTSRGWVMLSTDLGDSWKKQYDLRGLATMLGYTPGGTLLVGMPGVLLASTDFGLTFQGTGQSFERRTPQAFAIGKDGKLFLGTDSGLYFSTDDGSTWYMPLSQNMRITSPDKFLPEVFSIAIDKRNNSMYVGTNRGVLLSMNEGDHYDGGWLSKSVIYALAVNPAGEVFAGTTAVFSSDPNKRNLYRGWDVLHQPTAWFAPDTTIEKFDLDHLMLNSKGQLVSGVLFSHSSGSSWEIGSIPGQGSPLRVEAQAIDEFDIAYIAVGEKLYKSAAPKLDVLSTSSDRRYLSVYPNPASEWIHFGSEAGGDVTIINALGECVLACKLTAEASIDIRTLPAGSYICQLSSSSGVSRVPLAVVR